MVQGVTPAHKELAPSRLIIYLSVNKRCPCWAHTMPKRNADFRAKPKGLCIFIKSLNLWDLALDKKKKKQNKKISLCGWWKANASLLPYCS
ncbi:hypothetical protein EL45_19655 [Cellulophaga sp. E6(2014)]|nr:hypothetical protein EL45_19655 [Cellulophaga sp. E6(2014)]